MLRSYIESNTPVPEEVEEGNIEYKLRLDSKDEKGVGKLAIQMNWRLGEGKFITGKYEAYYYIGICDDGSIGNISEDILNNSLDILKIAVKKCSAEIANIDKINIKHDNKDVVVAEVLIQKKAIGRFIKETRVCLLGATGHGKTTMISSLLYQQIDDGDGLGRSLIFKHLHEHKSGVTSSIKHEIIGIRNGNLVNYKLTAFPSWETIVANSDKIISLYDTPGMSKYIKTTLFGLLSLKPHVNIIVINPYDVEPLPFETELSIRISVVTNACTVIVFTHKEENNNINKHIDIISKTIQKYNANLIVEEFALDKDYKHNNIIPYVLISNTMANSNNGMKEVISCLNYYSDYLHSNQLNNIQEVIDKREFTINETYNIPDKSSIVVSGILTKGETININDELLIGPVLSDGSFVPVTIKTIYKKKIDCKSIHNDESGSLEIQLLNNDDINKNMVIIDKELVSNLIDQISINILNGITDLKAGYKYTLYFNNMVEAIVLTNITDNIVTAKFVKENKKYYDKCEIYCVLRCDYNTDIISIGKIILN
jgi:GTPase